MSQVLINPEGVEYAFQETDRLGNGAFGDVYKGSDRKNLQHVAIKRVHNTVLDKYGEEFIRCLGNEANILQEMGTGIHTVIIIDCFQTANHVNIIMEYCDGGTLRDKLDKVTDGVYPEEEALVYFAEIVDGLYAIHNSGRMHRDMKLENVFLKEGHCKIGDFGFATKQQESDQYVGTPEYMAPEIFECGDGNVYGKEVDIWALGIMLHEMLFGDRPFVGPQTQLGDIIKSRPYEPPSYPEVSAKCKDLLKRMLTVDTKKRAKIDEIKNTVIVRAKAKSHTAGNDIKIKSYESDDGKMSRSMEDWELSEDMKFSLTQSLTNDYVYRIYKKTENYRQCCRFFLNFAIGLMPYLKPVKNYILDDFHILYYYLLKFTYNKFSYLLKFLENQSAPKPLLKTVETDYWPSFLNSEKCLLLRAETKKGRDIVEKIFIQYREKQLPEYLRRAGRNINDMSTIYNNNLDADCTASFTGKLLEAIYIVNKLSQNKKDSFYADINKISSDLEFGQLVAEYMDTYEWEIDFELYKITREKMPKEVNMKKHLKMRAW